MTKKDINNLMETASEKKAITKDLIKKSLDEALKDPAVLEMFNAKMDEVILRAIESLTQESNVGVDNSITQLKAASKKR